MAVMQQLPLKTYCSANGNGCLSTEKGGEDINLFLSQLWRTRACRMESSFFQVLMHWIQTSWMSLVSSTFYWMSCSRKGKIRQKLQKAHTPLLSKSPLYWRAMPLLPCCVGPRSLLEEWARAFLGMRTGGNGLEIKRSFTSLNLKNYSQLTLVWFFFKKNSHCCMCCYTLTTSCES